MDAKQAIESYERSGDLGAELRAAIASPGGRRQIYELLQDKALHPFHALILAMFEQEMLFRKALGEHQPEAMAAAGDEYATSAIYRCAFLLYEIGDPDDVFILWQAKSLDFDIGCMMGVEYFLGAGVNEAIAFLEQSDRQESRKILDYIKNLFDDLSELEEQRRGWERARRADPDNVWL